MSAALSCLEVPYITLPSLNGSLPPDDDDKQGKNMLPYTYIVGNETAEKKAERSLLVHTHTLSLSPSLSLSIQSRFSL